MEENFTAVGVMPELSIGETIEIDGEWVTHNRYGKQFKIEGFKYLDPTTDGGMIKYLESGLISGIGKTLARRIVDVFGKNTLQVMDTAIDKLTKVEGIGDKKLVGIKKAWEKHRELRTIILSLQEYGVSPNLAMKIFKTYGSKSVELVKKNPYKMAFDIWGVGFKTVDVIGKSLGIKNEDPERIKTAIIYTLNNALSNGHTYLPKEELLENCGRILELELSIEELYLDDLLSRGEVAVLHNNVYLSDYYYAERAIEKKIKELRAVNRKELRVEQKELDSLNLSDEQLNAFVILLMGGMLILTGGPGTGKTSALKSIIDIYRKNKKKVALTAPTGRAAKRMTEIIGWESKTIHRLLEYNPVDGIFNVNSEKQLEADLLVVDEVSMVDTKLMYHLLMAVDFNTSILFVGDSDQLPSVGAGNVLSDLIRSQVIPVVRLTKIFRQSESSRIVTAAHKINKGEVPDTNELKTSDLIFISQSDPQKISDMILELCKHRLPEKFGFDSVKDIQVITPMYKGIIGADSLNKSLSHELNPNEIFNLGKGTNYKKMDKVMQLRNNYDKDIFNGDVGFIKKYDTINNTIKINFDGRVIDFSREDLDEITLAYAITVHKSQGSEYPCVILPLTMNFSIMLQRSLLYTAITRAKTLMVIIGTERAFAMAVRNNRVQRRYSSLFNT